MLKNTDMFLSCSSQKNIDLLSSPPPHSFDTCIFVVTTTWTPVLFPFLVNEPLENQRESVESMVYRGLVYLLMPLGYMTPTGLLHSTATDPPKRNTI